MLPVDMKCGDSIQFTIQQQLKMYGKSGGNKQFGCYLDEKISRLYDEVANLVNPFTDVYKLMERLL